MQSGSSEKNLVNPLKIDFSGSICTTDRSAYLLTWVFNHVIILITCGDQIQWDGHVQFHVSKQLCKIDLCLYQLFLVPYHKAFLFFFFFFFFFSQIAKICMLTFLLPFTQVGNSAKVTKIWRFQNVNQVVLLNYYLNKKTM